VWDQAIPGQPFTSWSLFLICDPGWLVPDEAPKVRDLQARYEAFGQTTGPGHAAVWFEKVGPRQIRDDGKVLSWWRVPGSIDVERNVTYCRKFDLVPSEGPHIVVTTIHPDRWASGDSKIVLSFGSRSAQTIRDQLSKLNDQIAGKRLSQKQLDSAAWWDGWREVLETACKWLSKLKWSVDAKLVKVERAGICN
jgi:hypothetical protein